MKNWKKLVRIRAMPALMLLALAVFGQSTAQAQNSAGGSKNSDTGAAKRSEPRVGSPRVSKGADPSEPGTVVTGLPPNSKAPRGENHPGPSGPPLLRKEGSLRD